MRTKTCVLAALFLVLLGSVRDISSAQQSGARFLLWRPTATSNSMGGVGTALYEDAFAAYFNPAGLAFSGPMSMAGSFVRPIPFFASTAHSYLSLAGNFGSVGAFAVSTNLFWKGRYPRTLSLGPSPVGAFDLFDWQAKVSYARLITANVSAGLSMSVLHEALSPVGPSVGSGTNNSLLFDVGIMARKVLTDATWNPVCDEEWLPLSEIADTNSHRGASIGFAIMNVGPRRTFFDLAVSDRLPTLVTFGVAYSPVRSKLVGLMLAVDLEKQIFEGSQLDYVHWGTELRVLELVSLRAGYFQDTFGPKNSYATWGGGIHLKFMSLNVARYTRALLPSWHFDGTFSWEL